MGLKPCDQNVWKMNLHLEEDQSILVETSTRFRPRFLHSWYRRTFQVRATASREAPPLTYTHSVSHTTTEEGSSQLSNPTPTGQHYPHQPTLPPPANTTPTSQHYPHRPTLPPPANTTPTSQHYPHQPTLPPPANTTPTGQHYPHRPTLPPPANTTPTGQHYPHRPTLPPPANTTPTGQHYPHRPTLPPPANTTSTKHSSSAQPAPLGYLVNDIHCTLWGSPYQHYLPVECGDVTAILGLAAVRLVVEDVGEDTRGLQCPQTSSGVSRATDVGGEE